VSRINGDRARADRKHNEKIHKRAYIRELRKRLEITGADRGIAEKNQKALLQQSAL